MAKAMGSASSATSRACRCWAMARVSRSPATMPASRSGNGNGVSLFGKPSFYAEGGAEATIQSPIVNIGDQEVRITGTKIVLTAGGGSITIDASGVTVVGTIVKIN